MNTKTTVSSVIQHPEHQAAIEVLNKLSTALEKEVGNEQKLNDDMRKLSERKHDSLEIAVAIATGDKSHSATQSSFSAAINESRGNQALLRDGIERQRRVVAATIGKLSHQVCEARRPQHVAAVKRIADLIEQLIEAVKSERTVRDEIEQAGYDCTLPGFTFAPVDPSNEAPPYFLNEARHYVEMNNGSLSASKKVKGFVLCDFNQGHVKGKVGDVIDVDELTAAELSHQGLFDTSRKAPLPGYLAKPKMAAEQVM